MRRLNLSLTIVAALLSVCCSISRGTEWVRAGLNTNQPMWGARGGLLWSLPPGGFPPPGGPRGLIRLGYPTLTNGGYDLINFIAIEPIVNGRRGFSELEKSQLDHEDGKRLWAIDGTNRQAASVLVPGKLSKVGNNIERLEVSIGVEPFDNGAKLRLLAVQRGDAPDELELSVHSEQGSAPIECCILTATMGNMARTRSLWIKDDVVSSLKLYPTHNGNGFAPHEIYPLGRLTRTEQGDVLAAVTTDEENPASVFPFPGTADWYYGGAKVTQYWKQKRDSVRDDLHAAVNARFTYWQSRQPIPGGVAFENFELRERFYEGQSFIFGMTFKTPKELGLKAK